MTELNQDAPVQHDFECACGYVLGLEPDHSRFRPLKPAGGRSRVTWKSHIQGLCTQSIEANCGLQFASPPSWLEGCHPHHRDLLLRTALAWKLGLPVVCPEAIAPAPGRERDYQIHGPPSSLTAPVRPWPATASLEEALPRFAEHPEILERLSKAFGHERTARMLARMQAERFSGEDGDALHDLITDAIANDSVTVWTAEHGSLGMDGEEVLWPIEVQEFCGVFQVWSPEHDKTGPFLSLDEAVSFVLTNWPEAKRGTPTNARDRSRDIEPRE